MAKFEIFKQIDVSLPGSHYPIIVCQGGLHHAELLRNIIKSQQVLIVTNETVAPLYLESLQSIFSDVQCDMVILPDGEKYKNQEQLFAIYDVLIEKKHHRDSTVLALGGGVIGDLAGFAASSYQRGIHFVQIPTTLLAQIDASVGGKTAINHGVGKNIIGSFYQPSAVIIDLNTLNTLPEREFKAGMAEMIKYSILAGGDFYKKLRQMLEEGLTPSNAHLPELIAECCRIKARFVEMDEREQGKRALLNLGHTFAHALESYTHYDHWLHGEAVAIGLYCAAVLSLNMKLIDIQTVEDIKSMLCCAGLPYQIPDYIDLKALRELMYLDKKIKNNALRFVVIKKPGDCYLAETVSEPCLHDTLISVVGGRI